MSLTLLKERAGSRKGRVTAPYSTLPRLRQVPQQDQQNPGHLKSDLKTADPDIEFDHCEPSNVDVFQSVSVRFLSISAASIPVAAPGRQRREGQRTSKL
jgi:hypothetical protein